MADYINVTSLNRLARHVLYFKGRDRQRKKRDVP